MNLELAVYVNKKLLIMFKSGNNITKKVGVLNWVGVHFLELVENRTKHILPISSIIRVEVVE